MSVRVIGPVLLTAALIGLGCAAATAQPDNSTVTSTPFTSPNTDACPFQRAPAPAIDLSEVPAPGNPTPTPLAVPADPVGGDELGGCGVVTPDGAPPVPADISATSWVVSDLDTGQVLAAKDPHGRYRPASTIKILLSLVALRELDLNKTVTGTIEDSEVEGTRVGIGPGGQYTNRQLMHALVMASGNDAAHAVATQLGGDAATVAKMNDLAKSLGARDTRAATPAGLDGPGMSSSAYDLALLFREAMRIPTFAELVHTEQAEFPGYPADPRIPDDKDHPPFAIANDNQLLYNYDGALGGKTGFTDDARHTFVAGAERDGRRLSVTLMAADVRPIRPWEQGAHLLDYGFGLDRDATIGTLSVVGERRTDGGAGRTDDGGPTKTDSWPNGSAATLAAPPITAPEEAASDTAADTDAVRLAVLFGGSLLVLVLVVVAAALSRKRR
ncbi:D-alanyl-D-alanine carboxypeptidase [Aldersonia sp. NBC_00410]|uniref:D-alanyl-D-alanine carboxypeptidase family protein n=1 Tax=Aldersonia sp. NBC_00410 TaxID=2975954 RepID=UPI0022508D21|nr:D-alanyl-D-alanine carboxypeptidase family protein [Aldersonia sp. NBC_00410]MCX5044458.1 D-alanyl-D-alanine carboxypeptidase [Aldersonia sp. NBC_00410]